MPPPSTTGIKTYENPDEIRGRSVLYEKLLAAPVPQDQLLSNLSLFLESKALSRILFMDHIYRLIVPVMGSVIEFGTRWGANLASFAALRGIYEPYNRHRILIGFDTFEGFPSTRVEDGGSEMMFPGNLAVSEKYERYLQSLLETHESLDPLAHIRRFQLRKGDASKSFETFLREHPHTIVALAFFDFDLYEPTRECLTLLRERLVKGSVVAFDELNDSDSPGETLALMETFGLPNVRLRRWPHASRTSYFVVD